MANPLSKPRWSPYLVGAAIGVLSWITFGLMKKALGTSTTFVSVVGLIESLVAPDHVKQNPYLAKYVVDTPAIDWQMMLVIGLFLGALISNLLSKSHHVERVPELWAWRFGPTPWFRYLGAFVGGVLVLFGARLAGGCTSGHGISGGLQFAISSWIFFASFFLVGIGTAFTLFGTEGRRHV
jgi:uncharacterized membrane protein YedE/YeeE